MGKNYSKNQKKENRNNKDLYQTPYSVTAQYLPYLGELCVKEYGVKKVWEPAAGTDQTIYETLLQMFKKKDVLATDILDGVDFLKWEDSYYCPDLIITNPPFRLANEFLLQAFTWEPEFVAFLMPTTYLQGLYRYDNIYNNSGYGLRSLHTYIRYIAMSEYVREDGKYSAESMQCYSWFLFQKGYTEPYRGHLIDNRKHILNAKDLQCKYCVLFSDCENAVNPIHYCENFEKKGVKK